MSDYFEIVMVVPDAPTSADTPFPGNRPPTEDSLSLEELTRPFGTRWGSRDAKMAGLANATAECAELAAELEERNDTLSHATARSAELVAELEENNGALDAINRALSLANASSAELMATLELRDMRISELNTALAHANAEAAELMASLDMSNYQLEEANNTLEHRNAELAQTNECLRLADIELRQQTERLIFAEQQRVMIETLGTACHHLGQPFTAIALYLDVINRAETRPDHKESIQAAIQATEEVRKVFQKLRELQEYRTEPYITGPSTEQGTSRILAL